MSKLLTFYRKKTLGGYSIKHCFVEDSCVIGRGLKFIRYDNLCVCVCVYKHAYKFVL